jgi:hypothetical protein
MANTASKSGPISKLEEIVQEALVSRGMTAGEAAAAVDRLRSAKPGEAHDQKQSNPPKPRQRKKDYEELAFTCDVIQRSASDLAIRLMINGKPVWLPFSQLANGSDPYHGVVRIPAWLAREKGLLIDD